MMAITEDLTSDENDLLYEAQTELRHLKAMVQALRDELEEAKFERDRAVQKATSDAAAEINQLQESIRTLRDELEN